MWTLQKLSLTKQRTLDNPIKRTKYNNTINVKPIKCNKCHEIIFGLIKEHVKICRVPITCLACNKIITGLVKQHIKSCSQKCVYCDIIIFGSLKEHYNICPSGIQYNLRDMVVNEQNIICRTRCHTCNIDVVGSLTEHFRTCIN